MSAKVTSYLKKLSESPVGDRSDMVELIKLKNYGSNELSENEMWILSSAAAHPSYLDQKLKEAVLDQEAPEEEYVVPDFSSKVAEIAQNDPTAAEFVQSVDAAAAAEEEVPAEGGDAELSLDAPAEGGDAELSLDAPAEEVPAEGGDAELSLDAPAEEVPAELDTVETDEETETEPEIETSLAGVGILPLLAEIQEKLANGKPSEVELAALKAMKKLF